MSPKLKNMSKLLLTVLLTSLAASQSVHATQTVALRDCVQGHVQVNIAAKEQNRLAIEGRRIVSVVPSLKGILTFMKDEDLGALYFTMASETPSAGTVTLFVTDDRRATCKLILVPAAIAGDDILIRPEADATSTTKSESNGRTLSYQRRVKTLLLAMAGEDAGPRLESVALNQEIPLWKEARLVLQSKVMDGDLVGETYRLTNISPSDMLLVEQELYRRGVLAVAIASHTLLPSEVTAIYIVRGRKEHE